MFMNLLHVRVPQGTYRRQWGLERSKENSQWVQKGANGKTGRFWKETAVLTHFYWTYARGSVFLNFHMSMYVTGPIRDNKEFKGVIGNVKGSTRANSRLLHPQHLDGILTGLTPYRLPLDTLSEYPEPWSWKISGSERERTCQFQCSEKNRVPGMGGKNSWTLKFFTPFPPISRTLFFSGH